MKNTRRIASVAACSGFCLSIVWQDGESAVVDMTDIIQRLPYFASLKDEVAFQRLSVIDYGTGIEWANGLDYSADSLEVLASEQSSLLRA